MTSIVESILVDAQDVLKPDFRTYLAALETVKPAKYYGAVGDGLADDCAAIQLAIDAAQDEGRQSVLLGLGLFAIDGPGLSIPAATPGNPNRGIALLGNPWAAMQQGSDDGSCVLRGVGGAVPILDITSPYCHVIGISFQNFGAATHAIKYTNGGRSFTFMCSFGVPNGADVFATAEIEFADDFRYEYVDRCEFESGPCIKVGGTGTTMNVTRCVFDPLESEPMIDLACNADVIAFHGNTFNFGPAARVCFDSSGNGGSPAMFISLLDLRGNEWDGNGVADNLSIALLTNVRKCVISGKMDQMGSNTDSPIVLTNSRIRIEDVDGASIAQPLVRTTDATSFIDVGVNRLQTNTTQGVIDADSNAGNMIPITLTTPGAGQKAALIHGELADPRIDTAFVITMTTGDTLAISYANPPDSGSPGYITKGQVISVVLQNDVADSPPTMGAVTFEPTQFHLQASVTPPAFGYQIEIGFRYDGEKFIQRRPSSGDVAF